MLKLSKDEFASYYYSQMDQYLPEFEKERKRTLLIRNFIVIFGIIIVIFLERICYLDYLKQNNIDLIALVFIALLLFVFVWLSTTFLIHSIVKNHQKKLKEKLYKTLFGIFDIDYSNKENNLAKSRILIRAICKKNLNIFSKRDYINIDDILSGNYNGINYSISDSTITYTKDLGIYKYPSILFDGLFLATKLNKNFITEIIIKTDKSQGILTGKQKVNLEDVEFEKYFDVYSADQIEARYIITTAFMERLKNYRIQKQCPIEVAFKNIEGMEENVFFFFYTNKDHFELPLNQSLLNQELFYNILSELYDTLDIIDALKLEQNIGM